MQAIDFTKKAYFGPPVSQNINKRLIYFMGKFDASFNIFNH